jgi:putative MATE family efflux protein
LQDESKDIEIQDPGLDQTAAEIIHIESQDDASRKPSTGIKAGRLAGLTMWQAIWVLSWPILASSLLQSFVGLVDTSLAAGISEAATDAVGVASYLMWLINLVGMALGVGATALVSRAVAKGRLAFAGAAVAQGMILALISGLIIAALIFFLAPALANWLTNTPDARDAASQYLRITSFGIPAVTVLLVGTSSLRAAGDSFKPLLIMMAINAVNIITSFATAGVDWVITSVNDDGSLRENLIFANPVNLDLGIAGIATGTLVAWLIGAVSVVAILLRGSHGLQLRTRRLRIQPSTMCRLVRVGLPNAFETMALWLGNFAIIILVNMMAIPGMLGVHVVAVRIEAFSFLPGFAMGIAAATLAGQHIGAKQPDMARKATMRCAMIATLIMFGFGVIFFVFPQQIVGVFSRQPMHLEIAPKLLRICALIQIPFALSIVVRSVLRGIGDTKVVLSLTIISTYALRLPLAWLFSGVDITISESFVINNPAPLAQWDIEPLVGVWIGLCGEIIIRCMMFMTRFAGNAWTKIKV